MLVSGGTGLLDIEIVSSRFSCARGSTLVAGLPLTTPEWSRSGSVDSTTGGDESIRASVAGKSADRSPFAWVLDRGDDWGLCLAALPAHLVSGSPRCGLAFNEVREGSQRTNARQNRAIHPMRVPPSARGPRSRNQDTEHYPGGCIKFLDRIQNFSGPGQEAGVRLGFGFGNIYFALFQLMVHKMQRSR